MNHVYQIIWNKTLGIWIVASEFAKRGKKRGSIRRKAVMLPLLLYASAGFALPTGNEVVAGSVDVNTPSAGQMQINQNSQKAIVNWQGFSIGSSESVNIQQPNANAALLNRVVGQDASTIQGKLSANGQVYLVNPNGVLFSKTAQVDVGGLVASTHAMSNQDFLDGKQHFTKDNATGSVINQGQIKTPNGGVVALIGEQVENTGSISTPQGSTVLAAGKTIDLDMQGYGLVEVKITEAALKAQINNNGIIQANGGQVVMTAQAAGQLLNTVINNTGTVEARGLVEKNGKIVLSGGDTGVVQVSGTLDASGVVSNIAPQSVSSNTQGGNITVSGEQIYVNDDATINANSAQNNKQGNIQLVAQRDITLDAGSKITVSNTQGDAGTIHIDSKTGTTLAKGAIEAKAKASQSPIHTAGKGGNIELLGEQVGVLDNATINASGENGGGKVLVGRDYQGKNPAIHNAKATYISKDSTIKADAINNGDGGKVIVWSDVSTRAYGDISAKGGNSSGNGGFIETSGHWLDVAGIKINASATNGQGGNWLLDPFNITIDGTGPTTPGPTFPIWTAGTSDSVILNTDIDTHLNSTNVTIYTGGAPGTDRGNITVAANISKTAGFDATLTLKADNAIIINENVSISSTSNKLDVILNADADSSNAGNIQMKDSSSISTNGGNIVMGGGSCSTIGCPRAAFGNLTDNSMGIFFYSNTGNTVSLNSGGGDIWLAGRGVDDPSSGDANFPHTGIHGTNLNIDSAGGSITLQGFGGSGIDYGRGITLQNSTVLSQGGDIYLGGDGSGTAGQYKNGIYLNSTTVNSGIGVMRLYGRSGADSGLYVDLGSNIGGIQQSGPINIRAETLSGTDSIFIEPSANFTGTGELFLQPSKFDSIGLAGGTGTFNLDATELATISNGFSSITIGNSSSTSTLTFGDGAGAGTGFQFNDPLILQGIDISIDDPLSTGGGTSAGSLTLQANNAVIVNANASLTTQGQAVILNADADSSGAGNIQMKDSSSITSNGGNIVMGGGTCSTTGCTAAAVGNLTNNSMGIFFYSNTGNTVSLNSGGGDIRLSGQGVSDPSSGDVNFPHTGIHGTNLNLDSGGGTVSLFGEGGSGIDYGRGITLQSSTLVSQGGAMLLQGYGSLDFAGSYKNGAYLSSTILNSGSGTMELRGGSRADFGLYVDSGTIIGGSQQTGTITLSADTIFGADSIFLEPSASLTGTGNLTLRPTNSGATIGLAGGTGIFNLDTTELATIKNGLSRILIGNISAGTLTFGDGTGTGAGFQFNDPLILQGIDISIDDPLSTGGGTSAGSLTLQANNAVIVNANASLNTQGQAVILNADADSSGAGNIQMGAGSSISTNGGNIIMGGGTCTTVGCSGAAVGYGSTPNQQNGIELVGSSDSPIILNSGNGNLILNGQGLGKGPGPNVGINTFHASLTTTGIGDLTLSGTGGIGTDSNGGLNMQNGTILSTTGTGNLSITGTGGNGTGIFNIGIWSSSATLNSGGNLTLNGTGGAGTDSNYGIGLVDTNLITNGGTLSLSGTGNGTGNSNFGIYTSSFVTPNTTFTSGSGSMILDGRGGDSSAGLYLGSGTVIGGAEGQTGPITLIADTGSGTDSIVLEGATAPMIQGTGNLILEPLNNDTSIGLKDGPGVFNLSSTELGSIRKGFDILYIGKVTGTGLVTIGNGDVTQPGTGLGDNLYILTPGVGSAGIIQEGEITTDPGKFLFLASGGGYANIFGGAGALNTSGGGRWLVYAASPSAVIKGGLTSSFRQYNTVITGSPPLSPGNGFIYASAPGQLNIDTTLASGIANNTYGTVPTAVFGYAISNPTIADNEDLAAINGTPNFTPLISSTTAAGVFSITYLNGLNSAAGYTFAAGSGILYTVNPSELVVDLNGIRSYDGTVNLNASIFTLSGLIGSDDLTLTGVGTINDKNVGVNKPVNVGSLVLGDGNNGLASNYTLTDGTHVVTITPAALTLSSTDVSKIYDGTLTANGTTITTNDTDLFGSDSLSGGSFAFIDKNAGTGKTVTVSNVIVNDGNNGNNYTVSYVDNVNSVITPASLTITANADRKFYDGFAYTGGNGVSYTGLVNNETPSVLAGSLSYGGNSQGAIDTGTYDITPRGLSAGNYAITYKNGTLSIINNSTTVAPIVNNKAPLAASVSYQPPVTSTPYEPPSSSVVAVSAVKDNTEVFTGVLPNSSSQFCGGSNTQTANCLKPLESEHVILPTLKVNNSAGRVKQLQMSANHQFLSLLLEDGSVRIWDFQQGDQHQIVAQNNGQAFSDISAVDDKGELVSIASTAGITTQDVNMPTFNENVAINESDINQFMTSNDGSLLLVSADSDQLSLWNSQKNQKLWQLPYDRGVINGLALSDNKQYGAVLSRQQGAYVLLPTDLKLKSLTDAVNIIDLGTGKIIKSLPNVGEQILSMQFIDNDTLQLKLASGEMLNWSIASNNPKTVANFAANVTAVDTKNKSYAYVLEDGTVRVGYGQGDVLLSIKNKDNPFKNAILLDGDKKLLTVMDNGELSLWDVATNKKLLRLFSTQQGWTVMDPYGRFDGSEDAMENFSWLASEEDIPLDSFSENYYEPGLLSSVLQNQDYLNSNPNMVKNGITLPPKVVLQIAEQQAQDDSLTLQLDVFDRGGGINRIHVYQNGKLLSNENGVTQQSLQEKDADHQSLTLKITPSAGKNSVKVIASNDMGIENSSTELSFDGKTKAYASSLRLLTIGIDQYSDEKFNLEYSVKDAASIAQAIKNTSTIAVSKTLYNENATKPKILAELKELSQGVQQDVLVIYFAGHGLAVDKEWYFLPHETQMRPSLEEIAASGITATELSDIFKSSKIQHILLMVDSCYSGAGLDAFSKLKNSQRYFTRQLSRSLGITVMTAATKDQEAFELKSLGHGLFTYLITQELQANDAAQPVTAHGIADSIAKNLPVFSKKVLGRSQEPAVYAKGNDFMLTNLGKDATKANDAESNGSSIAPENQPSR